MSKKFENFQISKANLEDFLVKISTDLDQSSYVNIKIPKTWRFFDRGFYSKPRTCLIRAKYSLYMMPAIYPRMVQIKPGSKDAFSNSRCNSSSSYL